MTFMIEFFLTIDIHKFRSTNATWNALMLDDHWSVGYVTTLIELMPFTQKEEWEKYYYESGRLRELAISKIEPKLQNILQDEQLVRTTKVL